MKLDIRYENAYQTLELDAEETRQLCASLNLQTDGLAVKEVEKRIQDAYEEQFNRPDYNNWHKFNRHLDPSPKRKRLDGHRGYIQADPDDSSFNIMDYLNITSDDHADLEYEETCRWIREVLAKKPEWADAFIAVRIDGMTIREYAANIGDSENNITQKLTRAANKIKKVLTKP